MKTRSLAPDATVRLIEDSLDHRLIAVEVLVEGEVVAQLPTHDVVTRQNAEELTQTSIALHGNYVERVILPRLGAVKSWQLGLTGAQKDSLYDEEPLLGDLQAEASRLYQYADPAWVEKQQEFDRLALRTARRLGYADQDVLFAIQETVRPDLLAIAGVDPGIIDGDQLRETAIRLLELRDDVGVSA